MSGNIIALDIGTTNIKAALISPTTAAVLSSRSCPLRTIISGDRVEIDPLLLWSDAQRLARDVGDGTEVAGIGISTHRGTFVTCDRETGEPLHNLITWADRRAAGLCDQYNERYTTRIGKSLLWLLGKITGSSHLTCLSTFGVSAANVHFRYAWVLKNVAQTQRLLAKDRLVFATLDCWLVYKLTGNWRTDFSNAAATGLYDMWGMSWCSLMSVVFGHPRSPFPEVLPSDGHYGVTDVLGRGSSVPVCGVIADMQASHIGNCVTDRLHIKVTMGTCISSSLITDTDIHPSASTIFPQLAWRWRGEEACYQAECMTKKLEGWKIDLLVSSGLVDSLSDVDDIASSVDIEECPYFVADSPLSDPRKGMKELQDDHSTGHLVRSVLEAHAFTAAALVLELQEFYTVAPPSVVVDGGASKSRVILQTIADVTGAEVHQAGQVDGALHGAYRVAARGLGIEVGVGETAIREVFVCDNERRNIVLKRFFIWRDFSGF